MSVNDVMYWKQKSEIAEQDRRKLQKELAEAKRKADEDEYIESMNRFARTIKPSDARNLRLRSERDLVNPSQPKNFSRKKGQKPFTYKGLPNAKK
jgi:hypothetical protein